MLVLLNSLFPAFLFCQGCRRNFSTSVLQKLCEFKLCWCRRRCKRLIIVICFVNIRKNAPNRWYLRLGDSCGKPGHYLHLKKRVLKGRGINAIFLPKFSPNLHFPAYFLLKSHSHSHFLFEIPIPIDPNLIFPIVGKSQFSFYTFRPLNEGQSVAFVVLPEE